MSLQTKNDCFTVGSSPNALFYQLQQLIHEIITPDTETLIATLIIRLEEYLKANDDKDAAHWRDIKNRLITSESAILERFTSTLTQQQTNNKEPKAVILELMDNEELDQRLLWLDAAHYFENGENSQRICHIKSSLGTLYPQHESTLPATPERLCESFSVAIAPLNPDKSVAQQLFSWFADHFKPAADDLWYKTDQLLSNRKPDSRKKSLDNKSSKNSDIAPGSSSFSPNLEQVAVPRPTTIASELVNSRTTQLVSQVDSLLMEDDLTAKKQDNTVSSTALLEVLNTLQLEKTDQQPAPAEMHAAIMNALTAEGTTTKISHQHEDRINSIGWFFHHILAGGNLPNEITKAIALLQIPILKQAIADDDFLANYHHPARRLLTALTSSAKYCRNSLLGDHVLMLIEHTVRAIIAEHGANSDIFQNCLAGFQHNLEDILQTQHGEPDDLLASDDFPSRTVTENVPDEHLEPTTQQDTNELTEEIILFSDAPESSSKTEEKPSALESNDKNQQAPDQQSNTRQEPASTETLHCGQWVEFIGQGATHRLRCKLSRVSEDQQRYIFVNRSGMTVAQRSASELQKGIVNGSVQILAENPIFDRAIQAVLGHFKKSH